MAAQAAPGAIQDANKRESKGKQRQQNGNRQSHNHHTKVKPEASAGSASDSAQLVTQTTATAADEDEEPERESCFICAEPIQYYALPACGHRTCHICSVRLRALYKKPNCTFCNQASDKIVFTTSAELPYEHFFSSAQLNGDNPAANMDEDADGKADDGSIPGQRLPPFSDSKLGVWFETRDIMEDTLDLLRFNCPDRHCREICSGWVDLKRHVRSAHDRNLCDLCTRNMKIFAQEHTLYTSQQLRTHIDKGDAGLPSNTNAVVSGFTGHPMCEFCRISFYDNDALFKHCRDRHEQCFICVRSGPEGRDRYFVNYAKLEEHFNKDHFACINPECKEKKFVVFETAFDLQAHEVKEHGQATMDKRQLKEARRITTNFTYSDPQPSRPAASTSSSNNNSNRQRSQALQVAPVESFSGPSQISSTSSFSQPRTVPGITAEAVIKSRRAKFSGKLTSDTHKEEGEQAKDADAETKLKHATLMAKVTSAVDGSEMKVTAFKTAVRTFRNAEMPANDLLDTIFSLVDKRMDTTESISLELINLMEPEEKRNELRDAWDEFRFDREEAFPSLTPVAPQLDGRPLTPVSRVSVTKKKPLQPSKHSQHNPEIWARVQQAANGRVVPGLGPSINASHNFPALSSVPSRQNTPHKTAWVSSSHGGTTSSSNSSRVNLSELANALPPPRSISPLPTVTSSRRQPTVNANAKSDFPDLPSSSTLAARRLQTKEMVRGTASNQSHQTGQWVMPAPENLPAPILDDEGAGFRKKKPKKQILFSMSTTGL